MHKFYTLRGFIFNYVYVGVSAWVPCLERPEEGTVLWSWSYSLLWASWGGCGDLIASIPWEQCNVLLHWPIAPTPELDVTVEEGKRTDYWQGQLYLALFSLPSHLCLWPVGETRTGTPVPSLVSGPFLYLPPPPLTSFLNPVKTYLCVCNVAVVAIWGTGLGTALVQDDDS